MKAAFGNGLVHDRFFVCFADISSWEACTVTRKLDPDLMSERRIRTIKDKSME